MPAQMRIDQAGLPAGTPGVARTDGLATGAVVTVTNVGGGSTTRVRLLWVPEGDTTAVPSLMQTGAQVWEFTPEAARYGSYRIELIVDEGLSTESRQIRIFGIRTPSLGLLVPAANERASSEATLENDTAVTRAASENNEPFGGFTPQSSWGWWRALANLIETVEAGGSSGSGNIYYTVVVGNALEGDTLINCDFLDPGDGSGIRAAVTSLYGLVGTVIVRRGEYTFPSDVGPIEVLAGRIRIVGEGIGQTIIRTSNGDPSTVPWRAFSLRSRHAAISDMTLTVPSRSPLSMAPTEPVGVVSVEARDVRVERVYVDFEGFFGVMDKPLYAIDFPNEGVFGGQVIEDVTVDVFSASFVANAANPYAFAGIGSGFLGDEVATALDSPFAEPIISRFRMVGAQNDDGPDPYYCIGMVSVKLAQFRMVDCEFDQCLTAILGGWVSTSGTKFVRGPTIRGVTVRMPGNLAASSTLPGFTIFIQEVGGTMNVDRVEVFDVNVEGTTGSGTLNPGAVFSSDATSLTGVKIRGLTITSRITGSFPVFYFTGGAGCVDAELSGIMLEAIAGVVSPTQINIFSGTRTKLFNFATDALTIDAPCDRTIVSVGHIRDVGGFSDLSPNTSLGGGPVIGP